MTAWRRHEQQWCPQLFEVFGVRVRDTIYLSYVQLKVQLVNESLDVRSSLSP